eukprot:CAMPEP_0203668240 /NCGR_PEP_ID=MMETSP0090-20130426/4926_1 /ASSEMBLY_ACC=CAM_ASM_001088 /TAXON_ID=426623 /ORGANISM="Chaetoceros affinis, Strain CCMP159" /LENGTH=461 /DNA_ID=CAMNT_0050532635 /DNA_START=337 /DNA_END=1722 /DNA_ORIENTATION=+
MPAPGDYWTDIVNIQGTRLGNTFTCTLQGFLIRYGYLSSDSYFRLGLSFYYACAIGFEMRIETLTKYIEPLIHTSCISLGLFLSLPPLFIGGYNVSYDANYCTVAPKPWFCKNDNSTVACVRGGAGMGIQLLSEKTLVNRYDPPTTAFIIVCLLVVCCRVYQKDREMAKLLRDWGIFDCGSRHLRNLHGKPGISIRLRQGVYRLRNGEVVSLEEIQQRIKDQYKDTKVIVSQSAVYFSVQLFLIASELIFSFSVGSISVLAVITVLWSVQGLYQLFIFIFHKVFNQRRNEPNISFSDALIEIFRGPGDEAFIISGIHAVDAINRLMDPSTIAESTQSGLWEDQFEESLPLVSSCDLSGNFGSTSLPTTGRSLISTSLPTTDDNSNISDQMTQHHSYGNHEASRSHSCSIDYCDDDSSRCDEDSSRSSEGSQGLSGLSGFSERDKDGIQQSIARPHEEVIND